MLELAPGALRWGGGANSKGGVYLKGGTYF